MRCPNCLSYIPEGLTEPTKCPNCGKLARAEPVASSMAPPKDEPLARVSTPASVQTEPSTAFAPYFTIQTRLCLGPASAHCEPSYGSVSFGPLGFSVVWNEGKNWEKISYRDLGNARLQDDSVRLTVRDVESRLMFFHPWLPSTVTAGARKRRAVIFLELLTRVKNGLTPFEIKLYQRRLS